MLKPLSCWILILLFCSSSLPAQNLVPDSILHKLSTAPEDTNKVMLYWKTGVSIIYQDGHTAMNYFKAGAALGQKLNYIAGTERCLGGMAFAFSLNAKYDSALVFINLAIPWAKKGGDVKRLTLAYINRADANSNNGKYTEALKDCDTAIQYAEKMTGNADALGRIYGIISGIYRDQRDFAAAEVNIDRSIRYFERSNNRRLVAQLYSDKADIYNLMEQPLKALPLLKEAIRIGDSLDDEENLSAYYSALLETYGRLERYDEARQAGLQSLRICEETGNEMQAAAVSLNLSRVELKAKNPKAAIEHAQKVYPLFMKEKDTLRLQIAANDLAEAYQLLNNSAEAYKYLKISQELGDTLSRRQFSEETARLQTSFEVKEKDKAIQLLNKEKELQNQRLQKQRFMMTGAAVIALLVLAGAWLLYNRNKMRHRMKELELRNRIAADLHDEVGSSLSSIHMLSQMASQKGGAQQEILVRMSTNARETMDKMGDIVWMIKPGETEAGNLKQRMERFAYEVGISKNIEVALQLDELERLRLDMEQRRNIYLIFKEALNNAAKYSEAKKIDISCSGKNRELQLMIKDEGKGFDQTNNGKGNGLDNMSKRAAELGGWLKINSAAGNGTTVTLAMPL